MLARIYPGDKTSAWLATKLVEALGDVCIMDETRPGQRNLNRRALLCCCCCETSLALVLPIIKLPGIVIETQQNERALVLDCFFPGSLARICRPGASFLTFHANETVAGQIASRWR